MAAFPKDRPWVCIPLADVRDWVSCSSHFGRCWTNSFPWGLQHSTLPQHLGSCVDALWAWTSVPGSQGPGPRSVLPSLQPLLKVMVSFLECWPCSSDEILKLFPLSHLGVYQYPTYQPSDSEIIKCGKSWGKNHQYPLNISKNKVFIYKRICSILTEQNFFTEFDTHFTEKKLP